MFQIASSLGLYNLLVVFYNIFKVLSLGQLGILLYIFKCFYIPPIEQEAEVTAILCLLHPLSILNKISNKKWLLVKVNLELLLFLYY